jgi:hypothetical protein
MCKAQGTQRCRLPRLLMAFDEPGRKDYACEGPAERPMGAV